MQGTGIYSDPFLIESVEDLVAVGKGLDVDGINDYSLASYYKLGKNLDFEDENSYENYMGLDIFDSDDDDNNQETLRNALTSEDNGKGWSPIGSFLTPFTGTIDGSGHIIYNIYIKRPDQDYIGLLACSAGNIFDLGLSQGNIYGDSHIGGLMGMNKNGTINNCYSAISVFGYEYLGGLVGRNYAGNISKSYAVSNVNGNFRAGGLVGRNYGGNIFESYTTGHVAGEEYVGGLTGSNVNAGKIYNSYSTTNITANNIGGGLTGINRGEISRCYAAGNVTVINSFSGGLVGYHDEINGIINNSYYDTSATGQNDNTKGIPLSPIDMQKQASFINWEFLNIWQIDENESYPYLKNNLQTPHPTPFM